MKKENITRYKPDPYKPHRPDLKALAAMTDDEVMAAALADPDAQPATDEQLARGQRRPNVRAIRNSLGLTQEEFARRFFLPLGTVRDWEQGVHIPDRAALVLLTVISREPESVERALRPWTNPQ
jgi:putative transcriptional regulator